MRISKKYRLTAAAVLAASSVVTVAPGLSHANSMYKDVSPSASYYKDLVELVNQGIISGYADKTFKPDVAVTRGHFAQMLAQLLKLDTSKVNDPYLSDVTPSNPFYKYIAALAGAGVDLSYTDGSFKPNQAITRVEAAQMLADALDLKPTSGGANYTDVPAKNASAVKAVVQNGLMKAPSSKTFNANGTITRAESVSLLTGIQAFQQDEGTFTFNSLTSAGQVSTSEGTYRLSAEMKKIFNSSNATALSGAQIKAVISNKQIIKVTGITFNQSGSTYGTVTFNADGAKIEGNVFIKADYLRLQNVKINGNVTVNDVASNNVTFDNVTVKQSVVIEDGYSSSFKFAANNSTIPQLYVKRDNTLVNTDQKITAIVIEGDADDVALNTRVGKVTIAPGMYPTITGYATIDEMIVERGANVDLRVNGTLAKLHVIHDDSTVYSNRNLLISDMLIPRGSDYKDIIRNYSIVASYIMSVKYPDSTNNLLGINKTPNIPDGVLHPDAGGGGDGSNTVIAFDRAVARAVSSFSVVPSGKSVTLTTTFNSMDSATKTALGDASYDYQIRSRSTLPETAKYTLEIKNGANTYTATVTGKQLNDGIKMKHIILKALDQVTNMAGATDIWTISVKTLNGTLDLRADLLIKDTVAKSAVFNLTGTDTNAGEDGGDKPGTGDDGSNPDKPGNPDNPEDGEVKDPVTGPGEETEEEAKPIAELLESYLVSGRAATLNISSKFKEMNDTFKQTHGDKTYDYKVTATNLSGVPSTKQFKIIVKNGSTTSMEKIVTAGELTTGVYISAYINKRNLGKVSSLSNNTDTSSIQFVGLDTVVDLKVDLLANDAVVRSMTGKVAGSFDSAVNEAFSGFTVSGSNPVNGTIKFGTIIPELLGDATYDVKMTVDEADLADMTGSDYLTATLSKNGEVIGTQNYYKGDLRSGVSLNNLMDFGKVKDASAEDKWSITFGNVKKDLNATFDLIVRNGNDVKTVKSQTATIKKLENEQLISSAKAAIKSFTVPYESSGTGSVADNKISFTTSFDSAKVGLVDGNAVIDYKIAINPYSNLRELPNATYTLKLTHNSKTSITIPNVSRDDLKNGVTLKQLLGASGLSKFSDVVNENATDEWIIEIEGLNLRVTFDIEVLVNEYGLHEGTAPTSNYKKSLNVNNSSGAISETAILEAIKTFNVSVDDVKKNQVNIDITFDNNAIPDGVSVKNWLHMQGKKSTLLDSLPSNFKNVKIIVENEGTGTSTGDTEAIDTDGNIYTPTNVTGFNLINGVVNKLDYTGKGVHSYKLKVIFDDIVSEQTIDFSFRANGNLYKTTPVTINSGNSNPIYRELDMAIKSFNADVDAANKLTVETAFYPATGKNPFLTTADTINLVNQNNLGNAKLDAMIKLDESFNEAPLDYDLGNITIKLNGTALTSKNGFTIKKLKDGLKLSEILSSYPADLFSQLIEGKINNWEVEAEHFKFNGTANVSLLVSGSSQVGGDVAIKSVPVTLNDTNNTWANYKDKIIVTTGTTEEDQNEVTFKFAHTIPKDFYKSDDTTIDKEVVLKALFGDNWSTGLVTADTTNISITASTDKVRNNTLKIVFGNEFIEKESAADTNNLGYYAKEFALTSGQQFVSGDGNSLSKLHIVFEKNGPSTTKNNKVYSPYSARFVTEAQYTKVGEYKSLFKDFDVTF
ncbi:MAG: S-layer homology domain-containing protein, partial [Lysinibacillus sp.]